MPWFELLDGSVRFLSERLAKERRADIRRRLPGRPVPAAPTLEDRARAALREDTVAAMRDVLGAIDGLTTDGRKDELRVKLEDFIGG